MCYSGLGHTLVSRILIPNKILTLLVTHKTQSITSGNNRHKGTNNSVADAIKRVSPLSQRPTEDVTPLHVLFDSIAVDQSCLDSV